MKITLAQFKKLNLKQNEYTSNTINADIARAKEISAFYPCEVVFHMYKDTSGTYYHHHRLILKHDALDINIRYYDYDKKYSISCNSIHNLKNITQYVVSDEKNKLVAPRYIGVLTNKKINDWISYYEQLYKNLEALDKENNNEEKKFLSSLKGLDVKFYNNGKSGEVIKNGIKFSFKIEPTFISQKIEVYYECESNLETFLQLADNNYTPIETK